MTAKISSAAILKEIDCKFLDLAKGEGYWYFIFDDPARNAYETISIYCKFLNQMDIARWVEDGKEFVRLMEEKVLADTEIRANNVIKFKKRPH